MTDITELAQSLKAAAEKATPGQWERGDGKHGGELLVYCDDALGSAVCEATSEYNAIPKYQRIDNLDFIALANPANILALVEALEKAQQRISQLESRTVTVNLASRRLPSDYVDGEFGNDDLAAIHNACRLECKVSVEKYLSAHGIVVKWEAE
ncbi:ead/Ea22-like family protein [Klebsiella pneumoniae]|uniref:ead/Ea22-like family protein n=1 Tax=Klebsiella pneumoniae TaxID=573 RepID=UPI003CF308ED